METSLIPLFIGFLVNDPLWGIVSPIQLHPHTHPLLTPPFKFVLTISHNKKLGRRLKLNNYEPYLFVHSPFCLGSAMLWTIALSIVLELSLIFSHQCLLVLLLCLLDYIYFNLCSSSSQCLNLMFCFLYLYLYVYGNG